MIAYLYLIKFEDGTETIAVGQEDHGNTSAVEEIFCSEPQYIDDKESLDDIIRLVKSKMVEDNVPDPSKRVIN